MAHVTFIHGISNKPPADDLLRIWREALASAAEPLPLGDLGVTSSMVYWADLLYEKPDEDLVGLRGRAREHRRGDRWRRRRARRRCRARPRRRRSSRASGEDDGASPRRSSRRPSRRPFRPSRKARSSACRCPGSSRSASSTPICATSTTTCSTSSSRRPAARRCASSRPSASASSMRVGGSDVSRPHVVVSHSMGTVIAYDCLKRVAECVPVDGLITIGSPLGLDEVQDKLQPGWSRERRLSAREGRAPLGQPVRPARPGLRLRSGARQRLPQGRRGNGRGHRGAERRHLAPFGHEVPAPAELLLGAAAHARA